jgi:hypothetical protein
MLQSLFTGIVVISEINSFHVVDLKGPPTVAVAHRRRLRAKRAEKEKRAAERAAKVQGERA